jgi:hypothetical protein
MLWSCVTSGWWIYNCHYSNNHSTLRIYGTAMIPTMIIISGAIGTPASPLLSHVSYSLEKRINYSGLQANLSGFSLQYSMQTSSFLTSSSLHM